MTPLPRKPRISSRQQRWSGGSRAPFCLLHTCPWPWPWQAGDSRTPHSVQPASSSRSLLSPQDPQEVLLPSSSEPPGEALEGGVRSAPRQPLSLSAPRREEAPELLPATGEVCPLRRGQTAGGRRWAAARPGGGPPSPPAQLWRALGTPPRPRLPAPAKGSSKQVSSFSPPDRPEADPPATHGQGSCTPKPPAHTFPPLP